MSTLLEELDLEYADPTADAQHLSSGGTVPKGKYHARLIEASEESAGNYTVDRLKFEILHGPHKGKRIEEDLFHQGKDEEKTEKAKVKRRTYYHRLGLLTKTQGTDGKAKYALTPNKSTIRDCLGAEVIIDVELVKEKYVDKRGNDREIEKNKLTYIGVFKLDDPAVKDVPRGKSDAPMPAAKPAVKAADLDGI